MASEDNTGETRSEIIYAGLRTLTRKGDSYAVTVPKTELENLCNEGGLEERQGVTVKAQLMSDGTYTISIPIND